MIYAYSFLSTGPYSTGYSSVGAALSAARREAKEDGGFWRLYKEVYIGVQAITKADINYKQTKELVESLRDDMYAESGKEGFLEGVPVEKISVLGLYLNDALNEWASDNDIDLSVKFVTDIKLYDLRTGGVIHDE